ncbi:MAG: oligopeptide transporter, OPT family [Acidobacteria bacterium]|nr:oligopeptide transporter, OPT family [Acidobacteriota bacterium]
MARVESSVIVATSLLLEPPKMASPATGQGSPAQPTFKSYIPSSSAPPEFTPRAVLLGIFFGLFFGAVTVYLALKVGLTVSASIPIAVLSIVIFKVMGGASILENNIVQTTGSAGESIAAGVVFTLPALVFLGFDPSYWRVVGVALAGGWLGVLFMIPLRRYLIVREHGNLKYPEGTACAEVLIAGERGGSLGMKVINGLGLGFVYAFVIKAFGACNPAPEFEFPKKTYDGGSVSADISPELLGVGYIIGYRISAIMVAGGVLSYLVFIPLIKFLAAHMPPGTTIFPGTTPIADMAPDAVRGAYVRYIGAGCVATGGVLNVIRAMPVIIDSFKSSIAELRAGNDGAAGATKERTDRDLPITIVGGGSIAVVAFLWVILQFFINTGHAGANLAAAVLMVIFGFLFVTVSSRLVGEIGSSSNPISGMTIATLMATCLIFLAVGWTGGAFAAVALSIGAVVCIASANAGATSQDLKTGFLLGATPSSQQIGLMLGVTFSTLIIGLTMSFMDAAYTRTSTAESKKISYTFAEADLAGTTPMPDADVAKLRFGADADKQAAQAFVAGGQKLIWKSVIGSGALPDGAYLVGSTDRAVHFVVERGIGSAALPAPQGQLMATVINGILNQKLPWNLILIGVFSALTLELCGVKSLPFAVGVYLPLSTTSPIFVGGLVKKFVDWSHGIRGRDEDEGEASSGVLFSSGLIAGGAIAGLAVAVIAMLDLQTKLDFGLGLWGEHGRESGFGVAVALLVFAGLSAVLFKVGRKREV